ncbi:unnamed protein product [Calypogeia fissa]
MLMIPWPRTPLVSTLHASQKDQSFDWCRSLVPFGPRFQRGISAAAIGFGKPDSRISIAGIARAFLEKSQGDTIPESLLRSAATTGGNRWRQEEEAKRSKWTWRSETGRRRKKRYPEFVNKILDSLQQWPDSEIEQGLEQWKGQLLAKEQSIILNEERSWYRALRTFSWLQKQDDYALNVFHYNIMLKILGRAKQLELVEKLWKEMEEKEVIPTNVSFSTLIDLYGKAGNPEKALGCLEDMKSRGIEPDEVTMNTLVNLHKQCGNLDAAEKSFNSFSRNVENCNTMIDLYGRAGRFDDATRIFSEMMELGLSADTVTFNTMIKVCGRAGRLEEAEAMFNKMQENDVSPDVATFNVLLAVFIKGGKIEKALDYFTRMKETEIVPDLVTFQTLLGALTGRDMVTEAETTLKEMAILGFRTGEVVTVGMARMYIRAGLLDKATQALKSYRSSSSLSGSGLAAVIDSYAEERLWKESEELFLRCQQSWSVENFNTMIKAYGLAVLQGKAWELFSSMEEKGVFPDEITYNTMIHTLSTASPVDVEKVERVRSEMQLKRHTLQRSSFNVLIALYGKLGKAREAKHTFEQMEAAGISPDGISYGALVNAFAEVGYVKDAERTAIAMRKAGFAPNRFVYTTLMKLYGKMNNIEDVEKMYAEMGRAGVGPDLFASNFLIHQYGKVGQVEDAERVFRGLEEDIGRLGVNEITLTTMLDMYKQSGLIHEALGMGKRMLSGHSLKDIVSYNSILGLYISLGRISQALDVFRSLSTNNVEPDMITYSIMTVVMKKIGSFQGALDLFANATAAGLSHSVQSLTALITLYARAGMMEEALQTCERLLQGGFSLDNPALNAMIYAYGTAGRVDESLRLFMSMESYGLQPDVFTYTTVITIYGKAGLLEGVSRMFKRMKQAGCEPSVVTYRVVIDIYRNAGKLDLAAMVQQEMQFAQYIREKMLH